MVSRAVAKHIRISVRKAREVIDVVRGKDVTEALTLLASLNKRAKLPVEKTVRSAVSNAKVKLDILPKDLYIARITADGGPMLKRFRAAAMGRAVRIRRRTCHITVDLEKKNNKEQSAQRDNRQQSIANRGKI